VEAIGDPVVRRYYREDLAARLRSLLGRSEPGPPSGRGRSRQAGDWRPSANRTRWSPGRGRAALDRRPGEPLRVLSPRLAASPVVRGFHSAMPPREALILVTAINHPWLLDHHAEQLAEIEFRHADADLLRRAILDAAAGHGHARIETDFLREALTGVGLGPILARVEAAITHGSDWPARPQAAPDDVIQWWDHIITLHRKQRTLHRELKEAERALGELPSDENLAWLRDLQERLAALEGTEASIEGFGAPSGRPARGI
jgi:DNA primase